MGACGRDPAVVEHIIGKLPAHTTLLEDGHRFVMKGRKGLSYNPDQEGFYPQFYTWLPLYIIGYLRDTRSWTRSGTNPSLAVQIYQLGVRIH